MRQLIAHLAGRPLQKAAQALLLLLVLAGTPLCGQSQEEARQQVRRILTRPVAELPLEEKALEKGIWEALAYLAIDSSQHPADTVLREAVGDQYQFGKDTLQVRLVERDDNGYQHFAVPYRREGRHLILPPSPRFQAAQKWEIRYLKAPYLALDMDGLRVFFRRRSPN